MKALAHSHDVVAGVERAFGGEVRASANIPAVDVGEATGELDVLEST